MKVIEIASALEGQIRLKDGTLAVFVKPEDKSCGCQGRKAHHWLDGGVLKQCLS